MRPTLTAFYRRLVTWLRAKGVCALLVWIISCADFLSLECKVIPVYLQSVVPCLAPLLLLSSKPWLNVLSRHMEKVEIRYVILYCVHERSLVDVDAVEVADDAVIDEIKAEAVIHISVTNHGFDFTSVLLDGIR